MPTNAQNKKQKTNKTKRHINAAERFEKKTKYKHKESERSQLDKLLQNANAKKPKFQKKNKKKKA